MRGRAKVGSWAIMFDYSGVVVDVSKRNSSDLGSVMPMPSDIAVEKFELYI
jgi:hypothetical protein